MEFYIKSFERNKSVIRELLFGLTEKEYLFREGDGKWNILEIVCHLYDEEREDFRKRLKSVLENPATPFEPIDPVGWVSARKYDGQNFEEMVEKFLDERNRSLAWLRSLENPALENEYHHPQIGVMSGRFILANWLAHDFLHIRQITRIRYKYLENISGQNLNYAGDW